MEERVYNKNGWNMDFLMIPVDRKKIIDLAGTGTFSLDNSIKLNFILITHY